MRLRALLVDGGGTLFPESRFLAEDLLIRPDGSLARLLPELSFQEIQRFVAEFLATVDATTQAGVQPTDDLIARVLDKTRPGLGGRARAVREALATDGWPRRQPFSGANEMLALVQGLGLRTILVSNTAWLGERDYWIRLRELGLADRLDGLVSSFDAGVRKPHRAMFDVALERAGCSAGECVMVGDSEVNDIVPAAEMGMRTIRVTMQYPVEGTSRADAVARSLAEVGDIIRTWSESGTAI